MGAKSTRRRTLHGARFAGPSSRGKVHGAKFGCRIRGARPGAKSTGHASGIEPFFAPRLAWVAAPKEDPLVQPEGTVVPEFHLPRHDPEARPVGRPRDSADRKPGRHGSDGLLKREAALQGTRLLR